MTNFKFMKNSTSATTVNYGTLSGTNANALAVASSYTSGTTSDGYKKITRAPVVVSKAYTWDESSRSCASGRFHLRSVLRHEYGHVLGLDHTTASNAVMLASIPAGTIRTLAADDRNGANALYSRIASELSGTYEQPAIKAEVARIASENGLNADEVAVVETCLLQPEYTSIESAREAKSIVYGRVSEIVPGFYEDGGDAGTVYYSKVLIDVIDTLKGGTVTQIAVPMLGGTDGETVFVYHDALKYTVGEQVVLYVDDTTANNEQTEQRNPNLADVQTVGIVSNMKLTVDERSPHSADSILAQIRNDIKAAESEDSRDAGSVTYGEPTVDVMVEAE